MPPTPQQTSQSSVEAAQWQSEMEVQGSSWNVRERTVIARVEQYLKASDCLTGKLRSWILCLVQNTQKVI